MVEIEVGRHIWAGLIGVRQGDSSQTGFMVGPRAIATAAHGLDKTQPVNICRIGHSAEAIGELATFLLWDEQRDLCVLAVEEADDFWFVADSRPTALGSEYLVISCVDRRLETTQVVNEGVIEEDGIEQLKLRSGQIQLGYSGAPVLDIEDGRLIGMVRRTRGKRTDLGGHAIIGAEICKVRATLGLDRDDRKMQIRYATIDRSWPPHRPIRGEAPLPQTELIGRENEIAALDSTLGSQHRRVIGETLAGKSTLTNVWARIPGLLAEETAYVDAALAPPASAQHPIVGMVIPVLGMSVPTDPFGTRSDEETLGLACWTVMRDLRNGRIIIDLQQRPVDDATDADLNAMMRTADQMNTAIIVVGQKMGDNTAFAKSSVPIEVGPVNLTAAADIICRATSNRISKKDAESALELVDSRCLLPGEIVAACIDSEDAVALAVALAERFDLPLQEQNTAPQEAELAAIINHDAGLVSAAVIVDADTNGTQDLREQATIILDHQVLLSAGDSLGIRVPASLYEVLKPGSFSSDAVRLDRWRGSQPFDLTADTLSLEQALAMNEVVHRVSERSLKPEWVEGIYQQIIGLESRRDEHDPSTRLCLPLWRAQIHAGNVPAARRTFDIVGGVRALEEIIHDASHLNRVQDAHVLVLAWWLGAGTDDVLGRAIDEWMGEFANDKSFAGRDDVRVVLYDMLRAITVRPLPSTDGLQSVIRWCLSSIEDDRSLLADPGAWTMYISLIGRASELSGDAVLAQSFLVSALDALVPHLELLKSLALAGDSRPLLTIARQERRLRRLERGQYSKDRKRLIGLMEELLSWTIENAPTADAFLTLLATDSTLKVTREGDSVGGADLPTHHSAASRIAHIKRIYRKWRKNNPYNNALVVEIEYRIIQVEWAIAGSLLRQARTSDSKWHRRPISHKLEVLKQLAEGRLRRLAALVNRFGDSIEAVELEARTQAQFQTALSIVQKIPVDYQAVNEILTRGRDAFPSHPRMALLIAAHYRQRREFTAAASAYYNAFALALGDPLVRLRSAVGACEALTQAYTAGHCNRDELTSAMKRIETYENVDFSASVVGTRARLELHKTLPEEYWDLIITFAGATSFSQVATNLQSIQAVITSAPEKKISSLLDRFLNDFTDTGLLISLGAMLVRSYELSPSVQLERLRAALVFLDGVRIIAGTARNTPSVNFHQARALLYACQQRYSPDPIGWEKSQGKQDIDLACSKFDSVVDLSVGSFHDIALNYQRVARNLRAELRARG